MNASITIDMRPRIAFVCDDATTQSAECAQAYIRKMGMEPVVVEIPPEGEPSLEALEKLKAQCAHELDGVVLMGSNGDIDPADYGEERLESTKAPHNRNRKPMEETLIQWALDEDKPLLGICAGMQRLNVYLGGKLIQHVDGEWQNAKETPYDTCTEKVVIQAHTYLGNIAGKCCEKVEIPLFARSIIGPNKDNMLDDINSVHHQAVDPKHMAEGLRVSAISSSNDPSQEYIVEAIEASPEGPHADRKSMLLGVQWHPEFLENGLSEQIFGRLAEHAKNAQVRRGLEKPDTTILTGGPLTALVAGEGQGRF